MLATAGLAWLTRIGVHSSYAADVLPPLLLASTGLGFVMSPSMNTGTAGVAPSDAGAASAMVNTGQQVGGSIGTSLLNTMAVSAAASYLASHLSPPIIQLCADQERTEASPTAMQNESSLLLLSSGCLGFP
jgi:hypothetical protein